MRLTIERTAAGPAVDGIPALRVDVDGVACWVWNGRTAGGVRCLVFIWSFEIPGDGPAALEAGRLVGGGLVDIESGDPVATPVGECRKWFATLAGGDRLGVYVRRIAVLEGEDQAEFERELFPRGKPADWDAALELIHPRPRPGPIDPSHN